MTSVRPVPLVLLSPVLFSLEGLSHLEAPTASCLGPKRVGGFYEEEEISFYALLRLVINARSFSGGRARLCPNTVTTETDFCILYIHVL